MDWELECESNSPCVLPVFDACSEHRQLVRILHQQFAFTPDLPSRCGSSIGDNVTVGHGAVLNGVTIEDEAFIGIGAVLQEGVTVSRRKLPGSLCLGKPVILRS